MKKQKSFKKSKKEKSTKLNINEILGASKLMNLTPIRSERELLKSNIHSSSDNSNENENVNYLNKSKVIIEENIEEKEIPTKIINTNDSVENSTSNNNFQFLKQRKTISSNSNLNSADLQIFKNRKTIISENFPLKEDFCDKFEENEKLKILLLKKISKHSEEDSQYNTSINIIENEKNVEFNVSNNISKKSNTQKGK